MRLDKFLKVSRLIKRRTLAKEVCDKGRIQINGRPSKASSEVKAGDLLRITFGTKIVEVKVLAVAEHASKDQAANLYMVLSEKRIEGDPSMDDEDDEA
ncbi:RNA-binding S4 domain-containing protein [Effusibacillus dendaii]|uniref:RQC P-site tRNA stabilizing factor n=1 Tax=Effusibacillus dendaii TaxID=2743772 RepID=A0A7I8DDQ2_9BACL|nr:RNA-binding S4 domain-containing protein [Effusibacillus dendaii]BCJ87402.1 RNA-binding S4 domain-containing protein [Effusibacillus dendaii]